MAISYADSANHNGGSVSANEAFTLGDLLFGVVLTQGGTVSMADTVNTGNYLPLGTQKSIGGGYYLNYFYKVVNVSSGVTPTISATSSNNYDVGFTRYTGFVLGATIIPADTSFGTGTGESLDSGIFVTSKNFEGVWGTSMSSGQTETVTDALFTVKNGGGWVAQLDVVSNAGLQPPSANIEQTGTIGASELWAVFIQGFYDARPPSVGGRPILLLGV